MGEAKPIPLGFAGSPFPRREGGSKIYRPQVDRLRGLGQIERSLRWHIYFSEKTAWISILYHVAAFFHFPEAAVKCPLTISGALSALSASVVPLSWPAKVDGRRQEITL
jgi:hypothetical protein